MDAGAGAQVQQRSGHCVTLFEKHHRLGNLLRPYPAFESRIFRSQGNQCLHSRSSLVRPRLKALFFTWCHHVTRRNAINPDGRATLPSQRPDQRMQGAFGGSVNGIARLPGHTARDIHIPYQDFLGFTRAVASATNGSSGQ